MIVLLSMITFSLVLGRQRVHDKKMTLTSCKDRSFAGRKSPGELLTEQFAPKRDY